MHGKRAGAVRARGGQHRQAQVHPHPMPGRAGGRQGSPRSKTSWVPSCALQRGQNPALGPAAGAGLLLGKARASLLGALLNLLSQWGSFPPSCGVKRYFFFPDLPLQ